MSEQERVSALDFRDLVALLRGWCDVRPGGLCEEQVRQLAKAAGLTRGHLWNVLRGERFLTPAAGQGLCRALGCVGKEAEHLHNLLLLHHERGASSVETRRAVWVTYAGRHGLSSEDVSALLERTGSPEAAARALGCLVSALGPEAPSPAIFSREARILVSAEQVAAAMAQGAGPGVRGLAPGLVALPDPATGQAAAELWSGMLNFARDGLLCAPVDRQRSDTWLWSADQMAVTELRHSQRRLEARLTRLASSYAATPADRLVLVLAPVLTVSRTFISPHKVRRIETGPNRLPPPGRSDTSSSRMGTQTPSEALSILGQMSFADVLRTWREGRPRNGRSDAWLALHSGLAETLIEDLGRGRTPLRLAHVAPLARAFDVAEDSEVVAWLTGLARLAVPISPRERQEVQDVLSALARSHGKKVPALDRIYGSRWYVMVVLALSYLPNFQAIPAWVCMALQGRITLRAAGEALDALVRLGLLECTADGTLVPTTAHVTVDRQALEPLEIVHRDDVLRLLEVDLDMLGADHRYRGCVLALPANALEAFRQIFARFIGEQKAALFAGDARAAAGSPPDRVVLALGQHVTLLDLPHRGPLRS